MSQDMSWVGVSREVVSIVLMAHYNNYKNLVPVYYILNQECQGRPQSACFLNVWLGNKSRTIQKVLC